MSSPFETQVWDYISKRRPLKLAFLFVAALGIASSALKTLEPVTTAGVASFNRYLNASPSSEVRERYGCAFDSGQAQWLLARVVASYQNEVPSDVFILNMPAQTLARCQVMYGFTPVAAELARDALVPGKTQEVISGHFANVTRSWNHFRAYLATKDRNAALLLDLGNEFLAINDGLVSFQRRDAASFAGPLHPDIKADTVDKLTSLLKELQTEFPYRLPDAKLNTNSAAALLRSINELEVKYAKYFKGEA